MKPENYDAWYDTPRGRWIGETESALLLRMLEAKPGDTVLDVGCGTGWFTRRLASAGLAGTGLDPDPTMLANARAHSGQERYVEGTALSLPFADGCFDLTVSITALCFVEDWPRALSEIVRVTRRHFVLGLLNRYSLLFLQKGKHGGSGTYHGAHWHTRSEVLKAMTKLPIANLQTRTSIFLPSGSNLARTIENMLPQTVPFGSFLAVSGDVVNTAR